MRRSECTVLAKHWRHRCILTQQTQNICTMLDQRRRRWNNVVKMAYKCFVFAWKRGGGGVVKAACLESGRSRVRAPLWHTSVKETKCFFPAHSLRFNNVERLRDQEVACSTSYRQGSNFEFCAWMAVSSHSSHHSQDILLVQLSLDVHKGGLRSHSFYHFINLP